MRATDTPGAVAAPPTTYAVVSVGLGVKRNVSFCTADLERNAVTYGVMNGRFTDRTAKRFVPSYDSVSTAN